MAWIYLVISGVLEVVWAISLKQSAGFTKPLPGAVTILALVASFVLLSSAVKQIPIGTAYAVWTGIGAVGTALLGMVLFGEPKEAVRFFCIFLIVGGMAGLKLSSGH